MSQSYTQRLRQQVLKLACSLVIGCALPVYADMAAVEPLDVSATLSTQYHRLLPLEGSSNFRDIGGYLTEDGHQVVRGQLFRSGAMTSLTKEDQEYLRSFHFKNVVDLRSNEERELFPNRWAANQSISYKSVDYSFLSMMGEKGKFTMEGVYKDFPSAIKPQLKMYFETLLTGEVPTVVNCSAGQDRTGMATALLLSALGVPRETIVEDYLLSTDFRRPDREKGNVDLSRAAEKNAFARMMLKHYPKDGQASHASPLFDKQGLPYLAYALNSIEEQYGTVEQYLERELGVDSDDIAKLRTLYLN